MGRERFGGSTGIVDHPSNWNEEAVGGGRRGSETERYSGLGAAAAQRQAYQADFGKAMGDEQNGLQARGQQDAGLRYMRQAAMGNAPSQAAILGNAAAGQGLQAQMQAGAGGRGLGAAAAQMQAAQVAPGQQLGAMQQYTGMRGNEMAHAQSAFGAGANQMRQGDYTQQGMAQQRAEAQARAEMTQRELNQAAQMGYEQMGVRGNQAQSEGELRQKGIASKENDTRDSAHDREENRFMNYAKGATKTVAGWFGLSDENAKQGIRPMLSDDKTKLAKAWEEGRQATINDVQALRQKSPEELKALGAKGNSLANAVRGAKADAYDQARGVPQHIMTVPPELQHPPPQEVQPSGMLHQQPKAPERRAAVDSVEREIPDTRPDYQKLVNQTLFGTPDMSDASLQASMGSDKRMKEGAHEEGEMGRQLAKGFKPFEYEYKPEFAGHEGQQQGEKNVGPMAQDMAANPITATAVSKRPDGLLQIDIPKVTKINSAGIGYLAAELQKLKERR